MDVKAEAKIPAPTKKVEQDMNRIIAWMLAMSRNVIVMWKADRGEPIVNVLDAGFVHPDLTTSQCMGAGAISREVSVALKDTNLKDQLFRIVCVHGTASMGVKEGMITTQQFGSFKIKLCPTTGCCTHTNRLGFGELPENVQNHITSRFLSMESTPDAALQQLILSGGSATTRIIISEIAPVLL